MVSPDLQHPRRIQAETPLSRLSRFFRPPLTIDITRLGRPVARLAAVARPRKRIDLAMLL